MKKILLSTTGAALLALVPLSSVYAQEALPPPAIRTHAEAIVTATPDLAYLDIGVVTEARTAQAAAEQNALKLDAVLKSLREELKQAAEFKTAGYMVNPNYRHPQDGGQAILTGYTATNTVQAKIFQLVLVGKIIDIATRAGANQIQQLQFTLKDQERLEHQALREAAAKARAKAEAMAAALGLRIVGIRLAEESGQHFKPYMPEMLSVRDSAMAAVPTPIEPGSVEVRATVNLTVDIGVPAQK